MSKSNILCMIRLGTNLFVFMMSIKTYNDQKDARIQGYDFMYRAEFQATYNAFGDVSGLVNGFFSFSGWQIRTTR